MHARMHKQKKKKQKQNKTHQEMSPVALVNSADPVNLIFKVIRQLSHMDAVAKLKLIKW